MARRSIFFVIVALIAAVLPASAFSATAPADAPRLTSAAYASPVAIAWTPGNDVLNVTQSVLRAPGACTVPATGGQPLQTFPDNTTSTWVSPAPDGTWCYYIQAADLISAAYSPGLTVVVDMLNPIATVAVAGQAPGATVSGTVGVSGTGSDVGSGVATSVLHVGAVGACPAGPVVGPAWDTTALANGPYEVCNVVTDKVGHSGIATTPVTVANAVAPAPAPPVVDKLAPLPPTKLTLTLPRSRRGTGRLGVTLRWVNPSEADLDRVVVVLNLDRPPKSPTDGTRIYRGLGTSVKLKLRAGETGHVALYAYDHSGTVSAPARRIVPLASLIPLRPLTGSVVSGSPLLAWKEKKGTAYYNLQLYRKGKRVLLRWPTRASYRLPANELLPGTYVWYVWPAVRRAGHAPVFGKLIGRATFVYDDPGSH